MSEQQNPTPPAPQTVRVEVAAAPAPKTQGLDDGADFRNMTPEAFKERMLRERQMGAKEKEKEIFGALGVDGKQDRKTAFEQIKAGKLALNQKTEEAKAAQAQIEALKPAEERAKALEATVKELADQMFTELPENVQKFIADTVADEPQARLKAVKAARANLLSQTTTTQTEAEKKAAEAAAKAAGTTTTEKKEAKPATTVAPGGPTPPKPAGTLTPHQQWTEMMKSGKTAMAAQFRSMNRKAIDAEIAELNRK